MSGFEHAEGWTRGVSACRSGLQIIERSLPMVGLFSTSGRYRTDPNGFDGPSMNPEADHFRLAVATFDEANSLRRAVEALLAAGLSSEQLCLLARKETLAGLSAPASDAAHASSFKALVSSFEAWPVPGVNVVATAGTLRDSLVQIQGHDSRKAAEVGLQAAQRPDLAEHIGDGAVTIVVRSATPAQQSVATRTLLSRSSHRVKTYEFTFSPDGSRDHS